MRACANDTSIFRPGSCNGIFDEEVITLELLINKPEEKAGGWREITLSSVFIYSFMFLIKTFYKTFHRATGYGS